jgi:hypothetical protein
MKTKTIETLRKNRAFKKYVLLLFFPNIQAHFTVNITAMQKFVKILQACGNRTHVDFFTF